MNGNAFVLSGTVDPRVSATDAPKGSIYLRQNASGNGQVFVKLDNGSSINWQILATDGSYANTIFESLKNQFVDSPYQLLTTNIIAVDGATKLGTLTGATQDTVTGTVKFTANAQVMNSAQLLDSAEFLARGVDIGAVDLTVFWSKGTALQAFAVPTSFVYDVSRDGGNNWFTAAMSRIGSTEVFYGTLRFDTSVTTEATKQSIVTQATQDASTILNSSTAQAVSQAFTLAATTKLQEVILKMAKGSATPVGNLYVSIVADLAGTASTLSSDIKSQSNAVSVSGLALTTTQTNYTIDIPDVTLVAGTYHVVVTTDSAYKTGFTSSANNSVLLGTRSSGAGAPFSKTYNGTTYATGSTNLTWTLRGRALSLLFRITSAGSPAYACGLDGYGVFYDLQDVGVVGGIRKTQRFVFNSLTDNTSSFAITSFNPDPDLLTCYWVEGGQVFKSPAFQLNGNVATFPADTFNISAANQTITLIFDQNSGGSYDNSDSNARLMSANHLGSTSGTDDRSTSGRGVILRNAAGTLMELALDTDGLPIILSVP